MRKDGHENLTLPYLSEPIPGVAEFVEADAFGGPTNHFPKGPGAFANMSSMPLNTEDSSFGIPLVSISVATKDMMSLMASVGEELYA
jgi:hypothetical protein